MDLPASSGQKNCIKYIETSSDLVTAFHSAAIRPMQISSWTWLVLISFSTSLLPFSNQPRWVWKLENEIESPRATHNTQSICDLSHHEFVLLLGISHTHFWKFHARVVLVADNTIKKLTGKYIHAHARDSIVKKDLREIWVLFWINFGMRIGLYTYCMEKNSIEKSRWFTGAMRRDIQFWKAQFD